MMPLELHSTPFSMLSTGMGQVFTFARGGVVNTVQVRMLHRKNHF